MTQTLNISNHVVGQKKGLFNWSRTKINRKNTFSRRLRKPQGYFKLPYQQFELADEEDNPQNLFVADRGLIKGEKRKHLRKNQPSFFTTIWRAKAISDKDEETKNSPNRSKNLLENVNSPQRIFGPTHRTDLELW